MEEQVNYEKKGLEPKPGYLIVKLVLTEEANDAMKKKLIITPGNNTDNPAERLFKAIREKKINDHPFLVKVFFSSDKENIPNGTVAAMGARNWGLLKDADDNLNFINFDSLIYNGSLYWIIQMDWIVALLPELNDRVTTKNGKLILLKNK